jgi:hypothetical protein
VWNRFGDIRTFAVNVHLKFPFAIVAGVLAIPTCERRQVGGRLAAVAPEDAGDAAGVDPVHEHLNAPGAGEEWVSTLHIVDRLVRRLQRTRRRETEADAPHLLEAASVIVYNPSTATLLPTSPNRAPACGGKR